MKLLVTGGAGYVGSVCAAHLVDAGHDVTVLDDLSTGHADAVPDGAEFVKGDVARGRGRPARRTASTACCTSPPAPSWASRCSAPSCTGRATSSTPCGCSRPSARHGTPRLVFSSTAATYGEPEQVPITEDAPDPPDQPVRREQARDRQHDHLVCGGARAGRGEPALLQRGRGARPVRRAPCRGDPSHPDRAAGGVRRPGVDADLRRRLAHPGRHLRARLHPRRRPRRGPPAGAGRTPSPGRHAMYNLGNGTGSRCAR